MENSKENKPGNSGMLKKPTLFDALSIFFFPTMSAVSQLYKETEQKYASTQSQSSEYPQEKISQELKLQKYSKIAAIVDVAQLVAAYLVLRSSQEYAFAAAVGVGKIALSGISYGLMYLNGAHKMQTLKM